nr:MAG TPA: hypothetical protein [Caudoviricetes sp.]
MRSKLERSGHFWTMLLKTTERYIFELLMEK